MRKMNYKSRDRTFRPLLRKFTDDDAFFFLYCTWKKKRMLQPVTRCFFFGWNWPYEDWSTKKKKMEFRWCNWAAGLSIWSSPPLESAVIQRYSKLFGPVWAKFSVTSKNQVFWEPKHMKKRKTGLLIQILQ